MRIGKFTVNARIDGEPDGFDLLRIAQHGCAVMRCEHQAYGDFFEVVAEHPSFALVDRYATLPEYDCQFHKGSRTFKRKGA